MTTPAPVSAEPLGRSRLPLPPATLAGLAVALTAVVFMGWVNDRMSVARQLNVERIQHTLNVIQQVESLYSNVKSAETGQRGFLLTGEDRYLTPYTQADAAIPGAIVQLRALLVDDQLQL